MADTPDISEMPDGNSEIVESLMAFLNDFLKESDRAAVVVGAAKLDILLRQLLQSFLLPATGSSDELLDTERPLGTFSARIQACYRLGLIDAEMTRALHLVRRIRNEFAHETSAVDLSSGSYADRIRDLASPLKNFSMFKTFHTSQDLAHVTAGARDFRVALALLCMRLEIALHYIRPTSDAKRTALIPQAWREEKE